MCYQHSFTRFVTIVMLSIVYLMIIPVADASSNHNGKSTTNLDLKSSTSTEVQLRFQLNELRCQEVFTGGEKFHQFKIEDESNSSPEGWPDLPSVRRMVLIPDQSGVEIKIAHLSTHIEENINPFPKQGPIEIDEAHAVNINGFPNVLVRSDEAANFEGFWPPEVASIGTPAIMRGYRMISVVINPMRYNQQTRQLEVIDDIEIELDFTSENNRTNPVERPRRNLHSKAVFNMVSDLVVNPPAPPRDMGVQNGSIVYVMKEWDEVEEALQPLIEWRRRMGWTVEVLRVANNSSNQQIRAAIREVYEEWDTPPEMVIICGDTDGPYPMPFFDHRGQNNFPYESDHDYVMLDGNDVLPDAAVGRFIFTGIGNGEARLNDIVNKIVSYESDPFIGEGDQEGWQKRAALFASDARIGRSVIDVCLWSKELLIRNDYEEIFELYWSPDNMRPDGSQWVPQVFNSGISFYLYPGCWSFMNGFRFDAVMQLRNERMLPFVILPASNTGDYAEHISSPFYYSERFLYYAGGGGIGCAGMAGATHTAYDNLVAASTFRSIFISDNPYQGWATMAGKVELYKHYFERGDIQHEENRGVESWLTHLYIFNLMGDPATDLYTDIPHLLTVEHPESIRIGDSHIEVVVLDEEDEPIAGGRICLYKPEEFQVTKYTDENGIAIFNLDPELVMDGTVQLTVTGHNLMPYMEDFEVQQAAAFLGAGDFNVDDDGEGESNGDDDGIANPTERIELTIAITNYGEEVPEGEVSITLNPGLQNLEVVEGEIELENAPAAGESEDVIFIVDIGGGFPDEQLAIFNLECTCGEEIWISSVSLPLDGPELEFAGVIWEDEPIRPGEIANLNISIRNIGSKETGDLSAELVSLTPTISVPASESRYANIQPDDDQVSEDSFRLAANLYHLGGSDADLALILTSEAGFVDTAFFSFTVDQARDGQPFGPDNYGYICLDNTDVDWFGVPVYDWIEIDPQRGGEGDDTDLRDTREEDDESVLFDLPFVFTYYGQEFNEITICTNGWLAMGDCSELTTARNRRFPASMCAPGMIGPFWDDLLTTNDGGIYTFYNEENNIFIVEWSQMRRLGPRGNDEASETFQVILYDPEFYPSLTGDGDIVFQYLDVADERSCFQGWDTPFASVGICSPDQRDGLTYTYWNELANGATPLEDELAIKFTSSMLITTGRIFGTVTDAATGEPIEGATVYTVHGFAVGTDEDGIYEIEGAPTEIDFNITAIAQGYNDSTQFDFFLEDEGELEINFEMLHPEFVVNVDVLEAEAAIDQQVDLDFILTNEGNGQLVWRNEMRHLGDANAEPWELREQINVGDIIGDSRIQGVVFTDGIYYLAGSNDRDPQIYLLNEEGELIDQFNQPGDQEGSYGYRDLAFDGELIWGAGSEWIHGFTPDGELIVTFQGPFNPTNNLAWDVDRDLLWASSTTSDIVGLNREGEVVINLNRQGMRIYGLAYFPFDIDGYNMYIYRKDSNIADQIVTKMDIGTGDTTNVRILEPGVAGTPAGVFITNEFDVFSWVLLANVNNGGNDRLNVWQIDVRREWAIVEPTEGILETGESQDFILHLDASFMPEVLAEGELYFFHNADDGQEIIPVNFNIVDDGIDRRINIRFNEGWNMISLNFFPEREMYSDDEAPGPDIILMTEQLRIDEENHHIHLMKDDTGRFYAPSQNFNNIPYWDLTEGYQVNVDEVVAATWLGERIQADADIPLERDWNLIAYFPAYQLDASAPDFYCLSPIIDQVERAKDGLGRFMSPAFNFSNMPPWRETQGYQVMVDEDVMLNYPPEQDEEVIASDRSKVDQPPQCHWVSAPTDRNMSVLVTIISGIYPTFGSQIAGFNSDGQVVGTGTITDEGMCGLAVWGDDESTDQIDGLQSGESFALKLWDATQNRELSLTPINTLEGAGLIYKPNDLTVLEMATETAVPEEFFLSEAYPNPFNASVRLGYGLPEASDVTINVYDINGRLVTTLTNEKLMAGYHSVVWDGSATVSGIYFIRMSVGQFKSVRKVTLVK
jgi:hypothetical protein